MYHNNIIHVHQTGPYTYPLSGRHNTLTAATARPSTVGMVTIHNQNSPADLCSQPEPAARGIVITCISGPVVAHWACYVTAWRYTTPDIAGYIPAGDIQIGLHVGHPHIHTLYQQGDLYFTSISVTIIIVGGSVHGITTRFTRMYNTRAWYTITPPTPTHSYT